jgi:hypothetical protein
MAFPSSGRLPGSVRGYQTTMWFVIVLAVVFVGALVGLYLTRGRGGRPDDAARGMRSSQWSRGQTAKPGVDWSRDFRRPR